MDAVIVTADSRKDLEKLVVCEPLRRSFDRLIVVDNMSSDGSAEVAKCAGAEVIQVSPRDGYARCVNLGVRYTRGPRFAVLNPDIAFRDESVLPALETHFDEDDVGLVAPVLVLPDGQLQDSARRMPTPLDLVLRRGGIDRRRGEITSGGDVPWVVGACLVARRAAWEAIGGLDESYALYFEDVDLCWRLRQAGWKTRLDRGIRVEHKHRGASRKTILGQPARHHLASAVRFYRTNPRFIMSPRLPAVGAPARPAPAPPAALANLPTASQAPAVPASQLAAVPSPVAPVAAASPTTTATPNLLGSLDYVGRDWSLRPVDRDPGHAAAREPARWLVGRAALAGTRDDVEDARCQAGAQRRPEALDASRWLPGQRSARSGVAA